MVFARINVMRARLLGFAAVAATATLIVALQRRRASARGAAAPTRPGSRRSTDGRQGARERRLRRPPRPKFREAISLDPKLNDAYWRLAAILYGKKQYAAGRRALAQSARSDRHRRARAARPRRCTRPPTRRRPRRCTLLEDVVGKRPDSYAAQLQLGQHLVKSDPKKAAAALEAYLKYRPPAAASLDPQIHMVLGTAYVYAKEWDAAQREFEGLLKTKPNDMTAKLMLGSVLVGKSACSQAISLYERILAEAQKQPSIYYNLGTCYLQREARRRRASARPSCTSRPSRTTPRATCSLGDALYEQKNYPRALTRVPAGGAARSGQRRHQGQGRPHLPRHEELSSRRHRPRAGGGGPEGGERRQGSRVLGALAEAYAAVNAPKDKLNSIGDELASLGKDPQALATAGQVYFLAGNDERADRDARTRRWRSSPTTRSRALGWSRCSTAAPASPSRRAKSRRPTVLLVEAVKLTPEDLMTNRNLGLVLLLAKKYAEAEAVLTRSLKKVPNDMVLNRMLARAQLGQAQARRRRWRPTRRRRRWRCARAGPISRRSTPSSGRCTSTNGQLDQAVSVLETAVKEAGTTPVLATAQRNLAIAYFKRGAGAAARSEAGRRRARGHGRRGQGAAGALTSKESASISCGEAIAALKANKIQQAEDAWDLAVRTGGEGACAFRPPYDKLGTRFFVAYTQYRDAAARPSAKARSSCSRSSCGKVTGGTADWLRALLRSGYELLAYDFYQRSDEKRAGQYLASASKVPAKGDKRELEHNLAVIDMFSGQVAAGGEGVRHARHAAVRGAASTSASCAIGRASRRRRSSCTSRPRRAACARQAATSGSTSKSACSEVDSEAPVDPVRALAAGDAGVGGRPADHHRHLRAQRAVRVGRRSLRASSTAWRSR